MTVPAALAPLTSAVTYRRGVFLLLGGVLVLPYGMLAGIFVEMLNNRELPRAAVLVLVVVAAGIAAVPLFLRGTRALEIAAARALLDVELPDPAVDGEIDRETRVRCALWIGIHLFFGGLVGIALVVALPMALLFVVQQFGIGTEAVEGFRSGPFAEVHTGWLTLVGLATLVLLGYAVAGLGALAVLMAPVLLGPSQTERIAALEREAGQLAERNRLARELHDSVGHALTVTTLQAAAATELLDTDREFARRALRAIEETGRAAMAELDHVLGLLRQGDVDTARPDGAVDAHDDEADEADSATPGRSRRAPQRTLDDLDRLVADTRATGLAVTVELTGTLDELPAVLAREGYRIVQEGLTNAARYAGRRPVTLRVAVARRSLEIELVNATTDGPALVNTTTDRPGAARSEADGGRPPVPAARRRGRGLAGMRERVVLLGGRMTAGPEDGSWRVAVWLPTSGAESSGPAHQQRTDLHERRGTERT